MNIDRIINNNYDLVIVDTGLNKEYKCFEDYDIEGFTFEYTDESINLLPQYIDNIGHGTAVTSIIVNNIKNTKLLCIKLFSEEFETEEEILIQCLDYILNNIKTKIVHLSCGITLCRQKDKLRHICNMLLKNEIIIVSAFDNYGSISYPAAFDSVIGVDLSHSCNRKNEFIYIENSPINVRGIGISQRLPWKDREYNNVCSASFTAPHITVKILDFIRQQEKYTLESIKQYLKENSKFVLGENSKIRKEKEAFKIYKAIVLPFNKEIHSILRFNKKIHFEIQGFYDAPFLYKKNESYFNLLNKVSGSNFTLESWEKVSWNDNFDTVIIGHIEHLSQLFEKDILLELIKKCIKFKKNIFCFDSVEKYPEYIKKMKSEGLEIYYPSVQNCLVGENWIGKLPEISTPTLGIFGTSKKQGKYTLQLNLRYKFTENEYSVGQLGTEPSAEIFGMNAVYPMGYNSTVNINGYEAISSIRYLMSKIEDETPDIILVGSQSQTIPVAYGNKSNFPINNYELILGTCPDAFLLVVNSDDEIEYIEKSIKFLESASFGKVIALILSPINQVDRWSVIGSNINIIAQSDLDIKKIKLKEKFEIPVYRTEDIDSIYKVVVAYFS